MNFSTKAKNLLYLKNLNLKKSKIPKFYKFKIEEILKNKSSIVNKIRINLSKKISIRSSFLLEDQNKSSMAGEFDGLSNVRNSKKNIHAGIKKLLNQYKLKSKSIKTLYKSEILFQNHVLNSVLSGVLTNFCIKDGTEYYVVNYDDTSSLTNTVTSGNKSGGRVINIFKKNYSGLRSTKFKKIIESVKEIEKKIGDKALDIEFAITADNKVNILQIRPLSTSKNWKLINKNTFFKNLKFNQKKLINYDKKNKYFGDLIVFGLMPDWNPVEMIGYQPSLLSYSIYEKLITNNSWNISRNIIGYKKVNRPLMYKLTGKPFIDARLSFYSFIPKNVSHSISKKIVNFWCDQLKKKPYLHDKIEFEISDGSFDALTEEKIKKNYKFLKPFEKQDYIKKLKFLTLSIFDNFEKNFDELNNHLIELEKYRLRLIKKFNKKDSFNYSLELKKLIKKIKLNGTIPFSIYARYAFIGKKFLISLKDKRIISPETYYLLINSIDSIASRFVYFQNKANKNEKFKNIFDKYFYHLRPGTYDLNVKRYKESLKLYEINDLGEILSYKSNIINISKNELSKINKFLIKNNFNLDAKSLLNFCLSSIKLRENSKFIFTRSLSDMLELIKKFGKNKNYYTKDLSLFNIDQILRLKNKIRKKQLSKKNTINNLSYDEKSKLPYLITNKNDFFIASNLLTKPNFITKKVVKAKSQLIEKSQIYKSLKNKIILIENADPGYDWIFSKKIKALVTKYGGVNSHMSIRCEELNLPAVIGIGEENYEKIKNCTNVILNCKNEQVLGL
tara:strand:+ start:292 stop:2649 length:2358 start_codon:yes stop_codon:yes gene_type:complete